MTTTPAASVVLSMSPIDFRPTDDKNMEKVHRDIRDYGRNLIVFIEMLRNQGFENLLITAATTLYPAQIAVRVVTEATHHVLGAEIWMNRETRTLNGEVLAEIAPSITLLSRIADTLVKTEKGYAHCLPSSDVINAIVLLFGVRMRYVAGS